MDSTHFMQNEQAALPVSTPQSVEGTLKVMEHNINQLQATLTTKTLNTIWRRFELNVNRSGCDNILAWVNTGKLLDFIKLHAMSEPTPCCQNQKTRRQLKFSV